MSRIYAAPPDFRRSSFFGRLLLRPKDDARRGSVAACALALSLCATCCDGKFAIEALLAPLELDGIIPVVLVTLVPPLEALLAVEEDKPSPISFSEPQAKEPIHDSRLCKRGLVGTNGEEGTLLLVFGS